MRFGPADKIANKQPARQKHRHQIADTRQTCARTPPVQREFPTLKGSLAIQIAKRHPNVAILCPQTHQSKSRVSIHFRTCKYWHRVCQYFNSLPRDETLCHSSPHGVKSGGLGSRKLPYSATGQNWLRPPLTLVPDIKRNPD